MRLSLPFWKRREVKTFVSCCERGNIDPCGNKTRIFTFSRRRKLPKTREIILHDLSRQIRPIISMRYISLPFFRSFGHRSNAGSSADATTHTRPRPIISGFIGYEIAVERWQSKFTRRGCDTCGFRGRVIAGKRPPTSRRLHSAARTLDRPFAARIRSSGLNNLTRERVALE